MKRATISLILLFTAQALAPARATAIPLFARQHGVTCAACHVHPPALGARGEAFRAAGYRIPGRTPVRTLPFAVWASGRSDAYPDEAEVAAGVRGHMNKLELISGGTLGVAWLSYFVEWRPVSFEPVRRDGVMVLRDRSGRFEDIFLAATAGGLSVRVGQFRQIDQVDVSLRLGLSEPLPLSAGLGGYGPGTGRQRSLRGFSPAGRSPSLRAAWTRPAGGWTWTTSLSLPVPGELSIPLTAEARAEASHELEWRLKGVVVESFVSRGLWSVGGHAFRGADERLLGHGVAMVQAGPFSGTAVAGFERMAGVARGRWSLEAVFAPMYHVALGGRVEDRAGDGAPAALLPYVRAHFPGRRYTFYAAVEQRVQRDRGATLVELGTVF